MHDTQFIEGIVILGWALILVALVSTARSIVQRYALTSDKRTPR